MVASPQKLTGRLALESDHHNMSRRQRFRGIVGLGSGTLFALIAIVSGPWFLSLVSKTACSHSTDQKTTTKSGARLTLSRTKCIDETT